MQAQYDSIVIGSGIGGLAAAIYLAKHHLSVALITKESNPAFGNTYWAQGGIIFPEKNLISDLEVDIQNASAGTSSLEAIHKLINDSYEIFKELLVDEAKVPFERDIDGQLKLTREASHSLNRIAYKGDMTGQIIEESLLKLVKEKYQHQIKIFTSFTAIDLITPEHHGKSIHHRYNESGVVGGYFFDQKTKQVIKLMSKTVVLATGGIGALYLHHTNHEGIRGDGHAMALRAGARLINMEFVQFHPTAFFSPRSHRRFLISEAVRGESGILINANGQRFMSKYHPDLELAPRDVVSRAILDEMILAGDECVYLDITHKGAPWLKNRFPTIYDYCYSYDIDMTKEPIPVVPAAHYSCGGVWVDTNSKTSLKNLYAVGEVMCTGLHGANRLASTSLLEGLTWGAAAADHIVQNIASIKICPSESIKDWVYARDPFDPNLIAQDWMILRHTMWNYVGIKRSRQRLLRAKALFTEMNVEINKFYKNAELDDQIIGLRNAVEVCLHVVDASMRNTHSIGSFYYEQ